MKQKEILLFGATGQIGRNLVRKLSKNDYRITAVTRNIHQAGYILKTQSNPGYLRLVELKTFDLNKIDELVKNCSVCINLIGILYEKRKNQFKIIHTDLPDLISQKAQQHNIDKFIHLSALGIDEAIDSNYAKSKMEGEKRIIKNFYNHIILRPSIVYSVDDNFSTNFMTLLSRLPFFPLYYSGKTKFMPIHCTDLTDIIYYVISENISTNIIECVGPEVITFKEILEKLLTLIDKKRILIPFPLPIANLTAKFFELFPEPLITQDQLKLLKYDNVLSGKYKSNKEIGIVSKKYFDKEVKKYCHMWREGGQFSTEKYNAEKKTKI